MTLHREPVRVEFVDTDAGGRIHHTAALRYAERAEHQLLRACGWGDLTSFPRRSMTVEFFAPLRFGDELVVEISAKRLGRTSITYGWRALRDDQVCVSGETTCVYVAADGRPTPLPEELRAALGPGSQDTDTGSAGAAGRGPGGSDSSEN